jgi:dTDP-4-amino-4,6-dideoxygalactose transaminase
MTEFQAAFGKTQLQKFPRILASRKVQAERYQTLLAGTGIAPPFVAPGNEHVFQSYVTLVPPKVRERRDAIIKQVREAGVEVTIGTWHMPLTTYFRTRYGYKAGDFPVADDVFARAMSLPMHEQVTEADQAQVAKVVSAAVAAA